MRRLASLAAMVHAVRQLAAGYRVLRSAHTCERVRTCFPLAATAATQRGIERYAVIAHERLSVPTTTRRTWLRRRCRHARRGAGRPPRQVTDSSPYEAPWGNDSADGREASRPLRSFRSQAYQQLPNIARKRLIRRETWSDTSSNRPVFAARKAAGPLRQQLGRQEASGTPDPVVPAAQSRPRHLKGVVCGKGSASHSRSLGLSRTRDSYGSRRSGPPAARCSQPAPAWE
jgi:hypothetical protein